MSGKRWRASRNYEKGAESFSPFLRKSILARSVSEGELTPQAGGTILIQRAKTSITLAYLVQHAQH